MPSVVKLTTAATMRTDFIVALWRSGRSSTRQDPTLIAGGPATRRRIVGLTDRCAAWHHLSLMRWRELAARLPAGLARVPGLVAPEPDSPSVSTLSRSSLRASAGP